MGSTEIRLATDLCHYFTGLLSVKKCLQTGFDIVKLLAAGYLDVGHYYKVYINKKILPV